MTISIIDLKKYLGHPASIMLAEAPFKEWVFAKSIDTDLPEPIIDYTFPNNGLDISCDEYDRVATIFLHSNEFRCFDGELLDLPFSSTRQETIERLGSASKSGGLVNDPVLGEFGPWDRFTKPGYSIHIEYGAKSDVIRLITLMRADVVP